MSKGPCDIGGWRREAAKVEVTKGKALEFERPYASQLSAIFFRRSAFASSPKNE